MILGRHPSVLSSVKLSQRKSGYHAGKETRGGGERESAVERKSDAEGGGGEERIWSSGKRLGTGEYIRRKILSRSTGRYLCSSRTKLEAGCSWSPWNTF